MGSRDIVKYVVACSRILKPITAKYECTPPTTTPNKVTSSFSDAVNMSKYSTTYVSDHLCGKTTLGCSYLCKYITPTQPSCIANTKMFVSRQMCC